MILKEINWNKGYITFFFAIITVILMPAYIWILPPFLILWGIGWLCEKRLKIKNVFETKRHYKVLFILFILFYAWQLAGMLYSDNPNSGWENLKVRLSLVFFPLVLISPGEIIRKNGKLLIRLFAGSTLIYIIICFINAFINSVDIQSGVWTFDPHPEEEYWLNNFYGPEFSLFQHPSYQAMYVLMSSFICLESWFDKTLKKKLRIFWLASSVLLLISLYFLSSRAGLLAAVLLIPFYLFIKIKKRTKNQFTWIIILLGVIIILPVIFTNKRVNTLIQDISQKSFDEMKNADDRRIIWKSAFIIARDNYVWGLGTGDVEAGLVNEYKETGNQLLAEKKMNAHNQFLEILLENGIIGVILFIMILIDMIYILWKERNLLYGMFVLLMMLFFLFETMLNRLAGVSFFAMFSFLLLHINNKNTSQK